MLVDAGVDNNYVMEQLAANSIDPATIGGILLTHDHGDHVRYAYALLRRNRHTRLYATPRTLNGILGVIICRAVWPTTIALSIRSFLSLSDR